MREILSGFLSNDSTFGKLMTRLGIIIGANLMFVLFSLPVVTAGAALAALYHVMFKTLRGSGVLNPFRAFWTGFRTNFRQATLVWLLALAFAALAWADLRFLLHAGGAAALFRYPVYAVCVVSAVLLLYFFPTLAAFDASVPGLFRNAFFFLLKQPWKAVVIVFFDVFPLYLTYSDPQWGPLYAFIWFFFGFGAVTMLGAALLLPLFRPYLAQVDAEGDFILNENGEPVRAGEPAPAETGAPEKTEKEILEEMKKLGM